MVAVREKPPVWFWVVSALLLLWALAGLFSFYAQATLSKDAVAQMPDYDRKLYFSLPGWFIWSFALATVPAAAGAVTLLLRSRAAIPLYLASLVGIIIQFAWVLGATDLVAVKGVMASVPFPLTILVLGIFSLWFARFAAGRRLIG